MARQVAQISKPEIENKMNFLRSLLITFHIFVIQIVNSQCIEEDLPYFIGGTTHDCKFQKVFISTQDNQHAIASGICTDSSSSSSGLISLFDFTAATHTNSVLVSSITSYLACFEKSPGSGDLAAYCLGFKSTKLQIGVIDVGTGTGSVTSSTHKEITVAGLETAVGVPTMEVHSNDDIFLCLPGVIGNSPAQIIKISSGFGSFSWQKNLHTAATASLPSHFAHICLSDDENKLIAMGTINVSGSRKDVIYHLSGSDGGDDDVLSMPGFASVEFNGFDCDRNNRVYGAFTTTSPAKYFGARVKYDDGNVSGAQKWLMEFDLTSGSILFAGFGDDALFFIATFTNSGLSSRYQEVLVQISENESLDLIKYFDWKRTGVTSSYLSGFVHGTIENIAVVGATTEYQGQTFTKQQAYLLKHEKASSGAGSCLTPLDDTSLSSLITIDTTIYMQIDSGSYSGFTSSSHSTGSLFSTPTSWVFTTFAAAATSTVDSCAENVVSFETFPAAPVDYEFNSIAYTYTTPITGKVTQNGVDCGYTVDISAEVGGVGLVPTGEPLRFLASNQVQVFTTDIADVGNHILDFTASYNGFLLSAVTQSYTQTITVDYCSLSGGTITIGALPTFADYTVGDPISSLTSAFSATYVASDASACPSATFTFEITKQSDSSVLTVGSTPFGQPANDAISVFTSDFGDAIDPETFTLVAKLDADLTETESTTFTWSIVYDPCDRENGVLALGALPTFTDYTVSTPAETYAPFTATYTNEDSVVCPGTVLTFKLFDGATELNTPVAPIYIDGSNQLVVQTTDSAHALVYSSLKIEVSATVNSVLLSTFQIFSLTILDDPCFLGGGTIQPSINAGIVPYLIGEVQDDYTGFGGTYTAADSTVCAGTDFTSQVYSDAAMSTAIVSPFSFDQATGTFSIVSTDITQASTQTLYFKICLTNFPTNCGSQSFTATLDDSPCQSVAGGVFALDPLPNFSSYFVEDDQRSYPPFQATYTAANGVDCQGLSALSWSLSDSSLGQIQNFGNPFRFNSLNQFSIYTPHEDDIGTYSLTLTVALNANSAASESVPFSIQIDELIIYEVELPGLDKVAVESVDSNANTAPTFMYELYLFQIPGNMTNVSVDLPMAFDTQQDEQSYSIISIPKEIKSFLEVEENAMVVKKPFEVAEVYSIQIQVQETKTKEKFKATTMLELQIIPNSLFQFNDDWTINDRQGALSAKIYTVSFLGHVTVRFSRAIDMTQITIAEKLFQADESSEKTAEQQFYESLFEVQCIVDGGCTWDFKYIISTEFQIQLKFERAANSTLDIGLNGEKFFLKFLNTEIFKAHDDSGNSLLTNLLFEKIPVQVDYSSTLVINAQDISQGVSTALASSSSLFMLTQLFLGGSLQLFWNIINLVQLVYILPLINFTMPTFLVVFFNALGIFNFDVLNFFDPGAINLFKLTSTLKPFNNKAQIIGIETSSFLLNGLEMLLMLIYAVASLILFGVITRCLLQRTKWKNGRLHKFMKSYLQVFRYNFFLRFAIESYLFIVFSSIISLDIPPVGFSENISLFIAYLTFFIYLSLVPLLILIIHRNQHNLKDKVFQARFSTLTSGFHLKNKISIYQIPLFMARRIIVVYAIFSCSKYPELAVIVLGYAHMGNMTINLIGQPFKLKLTQTLENFNEACIILITLLMVQYTSLFQRNSDREIMIAYFIVFIFVILFVSNIIVMIVQSLSSLSKYCKEKQKKKQLQQKQKQKQKVQNNLAAINSGQIKIMSSSNQETFFHKTSVSIAQDVFEINQNKPSSSQFHDIKQRQSSQRHLFPKMNQSQNNVQIPQNKLSNKLRLVQKIPTALASQSKTQAVRKLTKTRELDHTQSLFKVRPGILTKLTQKNGPQPGVVPSAANRQMSTRKLFTPKTAGLKIQAGQTSQREQKHKGKDVQNIKNLLFNTEGYRQSPQLPEKQEISTFNQRQNRARKQVNRQMLVPTNEVSPKGHSQPHSMFYGENDDDDLGIPSQSSFN